MPMSPGSLSEYRNRIRGVCGGAGQTISGVGPVGAPFLTVAGAQAATDNARIIEIHRVTIFSLVRPTIVVTVVARQETGSGAAATVLESKLVKSVGKDDRCIEVYQV